MNYSTMEAGREMDALVAEKVMGWTRLEGVAAINTFEEEQLDEQRYHREVIWVEGKDRMACKQCGSMPQFSAEIEAAWGVVEKLMSSMSELKLSYCYGFAVEINKDDNLYIAGFRDKCRDAGDAWEKKAKAPTAPLAICRAALMAVEVAR